MDEDLSVSGFCEETFEEVSSRFSNVEVLGTHGHNVLARAKRYGRWFLLKGLSPDVAHEELYRQMLRKELDIMMRLQHPGVAQAIGKEKVEPLGECIVMEWVEGSTLKKWLESDTTSSDRKHVASQLLDAVEHIHAHGIAHRDLKPSNIMITSNGHNVKIIDFGLADTDVHAILKQPAGTEHYMAPEQASTSKPDVRNDIYSLGLVLREMNLGRDYKKPIARCLMPIAERYQSMEEMKADLRRRASRRRTMRLGLGTLGIAVAIAGTAIVATRLNKNDATMIVQDEQARRQVDSLQNELVKTSTLVEKSRLTQDSLRYHVGGMNDTIASLNIANSQLRQAQMERDARQQIVDKAIADGLSIIDATNAATHIKEHIDTVSDPKYVWIDWHYQTVQGEKKIPEYMNNIRNKFTSKELAEIEYALKEHCNNYESQIRKKLDKVAGFTGVVDDN